MNTNLIYDELNFININPGNAGASQTWNFGNTIPMNSYQSNCFVSPSWMPYIDSFPNTNIGLIAGTNQQGYAYYTKTSTKVEFNGFSYYNSGSFHHYIYSTPQLYLNYPATYNSTHVAPYVATFYLAQNGDTAKVFRSGVTSTLIDGYGTVITPAGTYTECLRIKFVEDSHDSLVHFGVNPVPSFLSNQQLTKYVYMQVTDSAIYDRFSISITITNSSTGTDTLKWASYMTGVTTGISQPVFTEKALSIFPNPVVNETTISLNGAKAGEAFYSIYDLSGKLISGKTTSLNTGKNNFPLTLDELHAGVYMLTVRQGEMLWKELLIKQ